MQLAILGRQPNISLAELESLYGSEAITIIQDNCALVGTSKPLPQPRLGGTVKSARVITELKNADATTVFTYLRDNIVDFTNETIPEGKIQLGVSVYGLHTQKDWLLKQILQLKKILRSNKRSVRIIENKSPQLEAAQVLYNKLTGPNGLELVLVQTNKAVLIARTTGVQNIDDYSKRDYGRPMRDNYVGMLPPKLAQIMINLAKPIIGSTILDPFCGTGVVLQEALLMGYDVYGTDLSQKMVAYTEKNIDWLSKNKEFLNNNFRINKADATTYQWRQPVDNVICETYLGTPLKSLPVLEKLDRVVQEASQIAEGFLKNLASQVKKGSRHCIALPAWSLGNNKFRHLPVLDHLKDLGYNRLDFVTAKKSELVYHRSDQIVARELTILEKI